MKYSFKELLYYFFHRIPAIIKGRYIYHNLIKAHWGRGLNNFGDCLSPDILKHYGLTPVYVSNQKEADIILAGSILQWIETDYCGYIVGTGGDNVKYSFPNAKVLAVRGEKTLANFNYSNNTVLLGDPGFLMSYVFPEKVQQKYDLGIIPHFVDWNTVNLNNWRKSFKKENVLFINPLGKPKDIITQIKKCRNIVSSSLHGLIIADTFHIPNIRFVDRQTMPTYFYDYKFDDYYSSLGIEEVCIEITGKETIEELIKQTTLKPIKKIESLKQGLDNIMRELILKFKKK